MYLVSEDFANKIKSDDRGFVLKLTFGSSAEITGATIQNITLDEIVNSTDALTMGCACSNKITINLINPPTDINYNGLDFIAEVGLMVETTPVWIPLGKFYVADAETNNDFKNLKLTAYDGFCKMTGKYEATVGRKIENLQDVYDDLRDQLKGNCGIVLKERTTVLLADQTERKLSDYTISNFKNLEITYAQAIGYVAGCLGEFARFDRNGELELTWYQDTGLFIDRSLQYMGGFKRTTEKVLTVTSISTGTKDNPIIRGEGANGINLNFENPYITDAMADAIYAKVNGFTYTPCQVKWRGNPAIQAGDIVQVYDKDIVPHNVLVMSQSLKISGGCSASIDCKGKSETTSNFSNKFESTTQKIERVYSTLEKTILDATNQITGNSGGYVSISDEDGDGKPDTIFIMDSEDKSRAQNVWCWNKMGLGFAQNPNGNAYKGPYRTAITADGHISADFITTGLLSADLIRIGDEKFGDYIHVEDGVIHFGEANNPMSLKLGNIEVNGEKEYQLAFYSGNTRIAYFSSDSFEIENLTDGKIRFQNFGFIPRKSGNLTFTKLT